MAFTLYLINNKLDKLKDMCYFIELDLRSVFNHIDLSEESTQ